METRARYAYQQFLEAVECLATSEGRLAERIIAAYPSISQVVPDDFTGILKERFILLAKALTGAEGKRRYPLGVDTDTVRAALDEASPARLGEIADFIFAIFLTLHRQRFGCADGV